MSDLTVEKLTEMSKAFADFPKPSILASASLFPPETALRFEFEGREYIGASPAFWEKIDKAFVTVVPPSYLTVWDLDEPKNSHRRKAFFDAMYAAMNERMNAALKTTFESALDNYCGIEARS